MNTIQALSNKAGPVILAGCLSLAIGAIAFLIARGLTNGSGQAVADLGSQPPEEPSISSPWPDLSGRVLHWQNYSYVFAPGSPDGANGQEIRGDIWLRIGPDNEPIALRGTFTYEDGSFHQDYLYSDGRGIIVQDEPVQTLQGGESVCRLEKVFDDATFADLVNPGEPMFTDRSLIEAVGFVRDSAPPIAQPALDPASLDSTRQEVLGDQQVGPVEVWTKEVSFEDGSSTSHSVQISEQGWLTAESHSLLGSDGTELSTSRRALSPIEVFSGSNAKINSVFDPATLSEGCSA